MSNQPEAAWVEAARIAAEHLQASFSAMEDYGLDIPPIVKTATDFTNSEDPEFFEALVRGDYFDQNFLADAE
jgi:hypothetical protein